MDLHYLELFNEVAKNSSFKKASEILYISQPALSIQIKKLESKLNMQLFYKTGNKIYLTEDGLFLYEHTKKIFHLTKELENSISDRSGNIGGTIILGGSNTPGTYILPYAIGEMKKLYPAVTFNLHIANTSEITMLIESGTLDVAVNGGNCDYHNFVAVEKLFDDKLIIVASPLNPLCGKDRLEGKDLTEECFIVHEKTSQLYTSFRNFTRELDIPENVGMYLGNIDAIKQAVHANLGISIMPYYAVKAEIESGLLQELFLENETYDYPYNLIYNTNKKLSITTQKFIAVLREVCNELQATKHT